jgi:ABC-type multidrug transport system permease subunit
MTKKYKHDERSGAILWVFITTIIWLLIISGYLIYIGR